MDELLYNIEKNVIKSPFLENLLTVYTTNPICNLNCMYCTTHKSDFIKELNLSSVSERKGMLKAFCEKVDSVILKLVGGGEIFLDNDLEECLLSLSPMYEKIVVVTNGVLLTNERLRKLSKIKNLVLCLSIDGHMYKMNEYRFSNANIFYKVLGALHGIIENGIDMEINMVLHDKNNEDALSFFDYLLEQKYGLTVNMSPLISKEVDKGDHLYRTAPSFSFQAWHTSLQYIIDFYDRYSSILLPKVFYETLLAFIDDGFKRQSRCYIPYFEIQLFSSGKTTPCPIIWNQDMGHFSQMQPDIYEKGIYRMLTKDGNRVPFCRHCFSTSDLLSLFMEDKIDISELKKIPTYNSPSVLRRMAVIKNTIRTEGSYEKESDY